jgi:vitamin B12/bleomycin/antimicrobial peptide transport system ATP-binding/permease protein
MTGSGAANMFGNSAAPRRSRSFIWRFLLLTAPWLQSDERWKARGLAALLVLLTIAQVVIPVGINTWSANLFDALEQHSMDRFSVQIGVILVILVVGMAIASVHLLVKRKVQITWRNWLTRRVMDDWMFAGHQFQVSYMPGEHDNPDGRISEDIRNTTEAAIDLAHSLGYCALLLVSFVKILWSLSGPLDVTIVGTTFSVPGHMVWVALIYASTATTLALLIGWPLIRTTDKRQTAEANFRFGLVRGRENAEAIALLHGESDERRRLGSLFDGICRTWNRQTAALARLFLFTSGYSILSTAFPVLIAAPRYIAGDISLGALMQTAQAFQQLTQALSWPVDNLQRGAEWRASAERVLALWDALGALEEGTRMGAHAAIQVAPSDRPVLAFRNLHIANPNGEIVLANFNAEIGEGERVLISGDPTASIKLFKVVAGLWPWGRGSIELPCCADIFFMPQRPYLPIGRLRSAVAYPAGPTAFDDAALVKALSRVSLRHLAPRLDEVETWEQALTPGEQQRLGFARMLLHRPNWIFIEEATDALDTEGEDDMMNLLIRELPGATVLTIGYHATLEAFHQRALVPVDRRNTPRPRRKQIPAAANGENEATP